MTKLIKVTLHAQVNTNYKNTENDEKKWKDLHAMIPWQWTFWYFRYRYVGEELNNDYT